MLPPDRPFTTAQALEAGLTRRQLVGPGYVPVLRGGQPRLRRSGPRSAGPADPLEHVTVAHEDDRRRRVGVRCHVAALTEREVEVASGVRITAPHRLFVDLAGHLSLVDLVVLGDWLVRNGRVTTASLTAYCATARTSTAPAARRAAAHVRERVDSPMETRLRMLLVLAGLPEPVVTSSCTTPTVGCSCGST